MWEALFVEYRHLVQAGVFAALTVYAVFCGDAPEKIGSLIFVGAVIGDSLYHAIFPLGSSYDSINVGHLIIDVVMLVALAVLAMRANRIYPLWLLAAQIISTAMHIQRAIVPEIHPFAYWTLTRVPSYLQMILLAVGVAAQHHRRRRGIVARPWRLNSR